MSDISKRFEQIVVSTQRKFLDQGTILPVKTPQGILVGNALIVCDGAYKHIYRNDDLLFENISLNKVAIKLANMVAWGRSMSSMYQIYKLDQDYNKLYVDSTIFLSSYNTAIKKNDSFKAEVAWTRHCETKTRAKIAREKAERLASF